MRNRLAAFFFLTLAGCASSPPKSTTFGVYIPLVVAPQAPQRSTPKPAVVHYASPREFGAALRFIEAVVALERIRKAHPDRHEATYNEAILVQEYGSLLKVEHHDSVYRAAGRLYRLFVQQAEGDPDAAYAVWRAREKLAEIDAATTCILRDGTEREREIDRKRAEQEAKQRAAEEEINKP